MVEISDRDGLKGWLEGKPKAWSVAIAVRAALRAMPALEAFTADPEINTQSKQDIMLPVFRAMALPFAAAQYPANSKELAAYAADAAHTADAAYTVLNAAADAADAAVNAAHTADAADAAVNAAYAAFADDAADAAAFAVFATIFASYATFAADSVWRAISLDAEQMEGGVEPGVLALRPLWAAGEKDWPEADWIALKGWLVGLHVDWDVWVSWYEDRLAGRNTANLPNDLAEKLDLKIARQDNEFWEREVSEVNREIREWFGEAKEEARGSEVKPDEPEPGPGPQYDVLDGKLSEVSSPPVWNEVASQTRLYEELRKRTRELAEKIAPLGNQFPALANAVREYYDLLAADLDQLDVVGVWSVGGVLASFERAYREQNSALTMENPLEPETSGNLQAVVRLHGAFILGFEEGRSLVERADEFASDPERLQEIEQPGNELLGELTGNRDLVDERTRKLHQPVSDAVHEFGWGAGRNGLAAYSIVRNATRTLIKLTVGRDPNAATVFGLVAGASAIAGDPSMEFARTAIVYLQYFSPQLLTFFNHSPEMRAYIDWALRLINEDSKIRDGK